MTGPVSPTPEQLAKLRSELDIVQQNVHVMADMLTEMIPGQEDPSDFELLQVGKLNCDIQQALSHSHIEILTVGVLDGVAYICEVFHSE